MCNTTSVKSYSNLGSSSELRFIFPFPSVSPLFCHQCLITQAFLFSVFNFLQPSENTTAKKRVYSISSPHKTMLTLLQGTFWFFEGTQGELSLNCQVFLTCMTSLCFFSVANFVPCIKISSAPFLNFLMNNACNSL